MADITVAHAFVCAIPDDSADLAAGKVCQQAHWNANLTVTIPTGVVTGLNADKLDGYEATAFSLSGHGHAHSALSNLTWSTAGHTIDTNVSWGNYNLTEVGSLGAQDFQVTNISNYSTTPITINLSDDFSANNDFIINYVQSGPIITELLTIQGDSQHFEIGRLGGVNCAIGTAAGAPRLIVKSGTENGSPEGIAVFRNSADSDIVNIVANAVNITPKLTVSTTGSGFTGNNKFGDITVAAAFPVQAETKDTGTTGIPFNITSYHTLSSGTAANGIGSQFGFVTVDNAGSARGSSYIAGILEDVTTASPKGAFKFGTRDGNTITGFTVAGFEKMYIGATGVTINRESQTFIDFIVNGASIASTLFCDSSDNAFYAGGSASGKIKFFATTGAVTQPAHIADPTDLATCITAITALNAMCASLGLTASA